ncbi:MAG: hypothetical protein JHD16_14825 [Solirubrobacteraceae bacterium]|nr:hypothetical protein [Solirubrobacteraceae bacterium]
MRAPIEPGNPGWDPDASEDRAKKIGAGLRGIGLVGIVLGFLFVSQQFTSSDDDPAPTSAAGPATVYAASPLKPVIGKIDGGEIARYRASPELRVLITGGAKADVFVGLRGDVATLLEADLCTAPVAVATAPAEYAACLVDRPGAKTAAGQDFLAELTGLTGRELLLESGFDVPQR